MMFSKCGLNGGLSPRAEYFCEIYGKQLLSNLFGIISKYNRTEMQLVLDIIWFGVRLSLTNTPISDRPPIGCECFECSHDSRLIWKLSQKSEQNHYSIRVLIVITN